MASTVESGEFTNGRGQKLYTLHFLPKGPVKARIIFHHGLHEHVDRYTKVFPKLADAGYAVHTYDCVGHGKSAPADRPGERGLVPKFDHLVDDLFAFTDGVVTQQYGTGAKLYLMGHSMGGLVACHAALRDQPKWRGLILHSAAIDVVWTAVLRLQAAVGSLLALLIPRAPLVPAVRPEDMSVDPAAVRAYLEDPLNIMGNVKVRTGVEINRAFGSLAAQRHLLTLPIYAAHGSDDRCTSLPAVKALLAAVQSRDKTLNELPGAYHELLTGPEAPECAAKLVSWLAEQQQQQQRAAAAPASGALSTTEPSRL